MSESIIRQKIFEIVAGQSGLTAPTYASAGMGMIHRYERWAVDWGKFLEFFKAPGSARILGWEICRTGAPGAYISNIEEQVDHLFIIRGYMAVKDVDRTEELFNNYIETLRAAFRADFTLGGLNDLPGGFSVETIDTRIFGSVLCHYCEIRIPVREVQI